MIIWTLKQETQVGKTWYEISHEPHFQNTMISRRSQFDFNESVQLIAFKFDSYEICQNICTYNICIYIQGGW